MTFRGSLPLLESASCLTDAVRFLDRTYDSNTATLHSMMPAAKDSLRSAIIDYCSNLSQMCDELGVDLEAEFLRHLRERSLLDFDTLRGGAQSSTLSYHTASLIAAAAASSAAARIPLEHQQYTMQQINNNNNYYYENNNNNNNNNYAENPSGNGGDQQHQINEQRMMLHNAGDSYNKSGLAPASPHTQHQSPLQAGVFPSPVSNEREKSLIDRHREAINDGSFALPVIEVSEPPNQQDTRHAPPVRAHSSSSGHLTQNYGGFSEHNVFSAEGAMQLFQSFALPSSSTNILSHMGSIHTGGASMSGGAISRDTSGILIAQTAHDDNSNNSGNNTNNAPIFAQFHYVRKGSDAAFVDYESGLETEHESNQRRSALGSSAGAVWRVGNGGGGATTVNSADVAALNYHVSDVSPDASVFPAGLGIHGRGDRQEQRQPAHILSMVSNLSSVATAHSSSSNFASLSSSPVVPQPSFDKMAATAKPATDAGGASEHVKKQHQQLQLQQDGQQKMPIRGSSGEQAPPIVAARNPAAGAVSGAARTVNEAHDGPSDSYMALVNDASTSSARRLHPPQQRSSATAGTSSQHGSQAAAAADHNDHGLTVHAKFTESDEVDVGDGPQSRRISVNEVESASGDDDDDDDDVLMVQPLQPMFMPPQILQKVSGSSHNGSRRRSETLPPDMNKSNNNRATVVSPTTSVLQPQTQQPQAQQPQTQQQPRHTLSGLEARTSSSLISSGGANTSGNPSLGASAALDSPVMQTCDRMGTARPGQLLDLMLQASASANPSQSQQQQQPSSPRPQQSQQQQLPPTHYDLRIRSGISSLGNSGEAGAGPGGGHNSSGSTNSPLLNFQQLPSTNTSMTSDRSRHSQAAASTGGMSSVNLEQQQQQQQQLSASSRGGSVDTGDGGLLGPKFFAVAPAVTVTDDEFDDDGRDFPSLAYAQYNTTSPRRRYRGLALLQLAKQERDQIRELL